MKKTKFKYWYLGLLLGLAACGFKGGASEDFEFFYEKFHKDLDFQLERTTFPLNGETSYLAESGKIAKFWEREQWDFQQPFDPTDTLGYTQKIIAADTIMVDVIFDDKQQGITRYFSKRKGKWFLTFYSDYNPINPAFLMDN